MSLIYVVSVFSLLLQLLLLSIINNYCIIPVSIIQIQEGGGGGGGGGRCHDRIEVGFTTTYAIDAYHH